MTESQIARFMWPTWGPPGSCRPQVGPMLAPWALLSGMVLSAVITQRRYCGYGHDSWGGEGDAYIHISGIAALLVNLVCSILGIVAVLLLKGNIIGINRWNKSNEHDDDIKWKYFLCYWPFVWGIHQSPVNSRHKGQWRGTLIFSLICAWIDGWVNNREAGDWRCHCAHYDVIVKITFVILPACYWIYHHISVMMVICLTCYLGRLVLIHSGVVMLFGSATDGAKPLPEPFLAYHQNVVWHSPENSVKRSAHELNPQHMFSDYYHICQGPMS